MVIKWSKRANDDIRNLKAYIAKDSQHYARLFTERLIVAIGNLEAFPKMGRPVPEAEGRGEVRELIYQGYRIIYLASHDGVFIVTIVHGSRDLERLENKPWEVG